VKLTEILALGEALRDARVVAGRRRLRLEYRFASRIAEAYDRHPVIEDNGHSQAAGWRSGWPATDSSPEQERRQSLRCQGATSPHNQQSACAHH
jgi:hypothetical protein